MSEGEEAFSWKAWISGLRERAGVSSIKARHALLETETLGLLEKHSLEDRDLVALIGVLASTASLYVDRKSRGAVLSVLRRLGSMKPRSFVKAMALVLEPAVEEAQPKKIVDVGAIPSTKAHRLALLWWTALALGVPGQQSEWEGGVSGDVAWKRLVRLLGRLLWGLAPAHDNERDKKALSMSTSAHRCVWRMVRGFPESVGPILAVLTDGEASAVDGALIGNVVSAASRLPPKTGAMEAAQAARDKVIGFIDQVLICSKAPVSYSSVADMGVAVRELVGADFDQVFRPSLSKMLVRSPEAAVPTILWLVQCLDRREVDLAAMYLEVFAEPLASTLLKSTNPAVRSAAADLLKYLAQTPLTAEDATAAAGIITKPLTLGRYTQADQRVPVYRLLGGVRAGPDNGWVSSVAILPALLKMAAKETQEAPVDALFSAIGAHFGVIADHMLVADKDTASSGYKQCEEVVCALGEAAKKGLALPDRSAVVRQAWAANAIGEPLWHWAERDDGTDRPWMTAHIYPLLKTMADAAEKATGGPLAIGGGILGAHVGLALALRMEPEGVDAGKLAQLVTGAEKSLVLWDKVYHKCVKLNECTWILRCAQMLFERGCDDQRLGGLLMWMARHVPGASLETVRAALDTLAAMSRIDAARLWQVLEPTLLDEMEKSLDKPVGGLCTWAGIVSSALAGAMTPEAPGEAKLLAAAALATHHPAVTREHGRNSMWIALVQRAGVGPEELCHEHMHTLKQTVRQAMANGVDTPLFAAGCSLVGDLVLVGGDSVALRLLEFAREDIDPGALASITEEDVAVWRTPEGQMYYDPVAAKGSEQSARKSGQSKDDAWAEQLQQEIARKKGVARKLTKLEQDMVAAQQAKEAEQRQRVEAAYCGLRRGLSLVRAVISGSSSVASAIMLTLVRIVVERAVVGGGKAAETLAGDEIVATVLDMSTVADGLAETLRIPIAMGLLRARGFERVVPENWRQESLEDLASRVYFRLRMHCEATSLPPAGFNFLLPFMQATAAVGGWGRRAAKEIEDHDEYAEMDHAAEQLTMVVDLVRFHAHFGHMDEVPRKEMLELLISLMAAHPTLLAACRTAMLALAEEMEGSFTPLERGSLVAGLVQPDSAVRNACLAALDFADLTELDYSAELWVNTGGAGSKVAALEENAELAAELWSDNGLEVLPGLVTDVIPFLNSKSAEVRDCSARSIGLAVEQLQEAAVIDGIMEELQAAYRKWLISLEPDYDEFGIVVPGTQNRVDIAETRVAVADALYHIAPLLMNAGQVQGLVRFLVEGEVLGERAESVRTHMLSAGARAVESHGAEWSGELMPTLERFLKERDRGTATYDYIREGVVVLLGRLAQHLPKGQEARVSAAVDQLLATLATPSEAVQSAVSQCLPPLAKRISDEKLGAVVEQLMDDTLGGSKYSKRRGGAYGLAGVVKGRGLAALKRFQIVDRLRAACENKHVYEEREGALFAFETLAATMGRLFEPYIIQFVPLLLALFGDPNAKVRDAAADTARVIMGGISGHGVKLILPPTLAGLSDDQWRTKKGCVEMLGAMAYCAPKQLSVSLPTVVPRIIDVLTDTHGQVSEAARRALVRFGGVIHNPEIQELVPQLLDALDDPGSKTDPALRTLLYTAFIHYIDAPSLALVVPILQRGMRTRNATTKRNAAQIMGSMATLTDPKDLVPYLDALVPQLRAVLVDPTPEARATAAKALGSLVQRLTEARFPSLVADLIAVLKSDASGVDRAGAAQGLSEVVAGIGVSRLEGLLPEIVANCSSARVAVREGFMMLLIYLPTTFGDDFQPFLAQVLAPVLSGLADENEQVRSAALRAGRILVVSFASNAVDILLPELLASMHHDSWRIRHSSIELLGELLYRVAGVSGKQAEREREAARDLFSCVQDEDSDGEEDVDMGAETDEEADEDAAIISNLRVILSEKLGTERCNGVLAALYVARCDVAPMVRQMSFSVWKSLVSNTPRTVRECLPHIMDILLQGLSATEYDRRTTAARTLGDLVHKLGEAVMSRVVPILENALRVNSASPAARSIRHGVFIGLSEILTSTGKAHIDAYAEAMIPLVRRGLCDEDVMVREAAATAFNGLQQVVGPRVIDSVVPPLLNALTQGGEGDLEGINPEHALEALRELMAVRANVVFPVLIPTLTAVPVTMFNARALSSLIQVAGASLSRRLPQILLSLFKSLPASDGDTDAALRDTVRVIVATATQDENTLEALVMQFHDSGKFKDVAELDESPAKSARVAEVCFAFGAMCQAFGPGSAGRGRTSLGAHVADWLRILIDLLAAKDSHLVESSWRALEALCKAIPKDDYDGYVGPVSRAVQHATQSLPKGQKTLPGFNLPKGVGPLLPIYSQGLLTGSAENKERAVRGMARLVRFTDPSALRLFATGITGPLIRIVGDRHPANVKAAILSTLGLLLTQIPLLMRPFLPQLQRTFVRGLSEQDEAVRRRAAAALAALIPLQTRLDPLVSELTLGIRQAESQGTRNAMMRAISAMVKAPNSGNLSAASVQAIEGVVVGRAAETSEGAADPRWRALRSQAFGALCGVVGGDAATKLIAQNAVVADGDSFAVQGMKLQFLAAVLAESPAMFVESQELQSQISQGVRVALTPTPSDSVHQPLAALPAVHVARNALLNSEIAPAGSPIVSGLVESLTAVVEQSGVDSDTLQAALGVLKTLAKRRYAETVQPWRDSIVAAGMSHVRNRNIPVKLAAERTVLYSLRLAKVGEFEGTTEGLNEYVANAGGPASERGKQVTDYHRRVLSKMADSTRELDYA
ncbi:translational activator of GCN4, partial [Coemansia sp. RSA 552]